MRLLASILFLCLLAGCQKASFTESWVGPSQKVTPATTREQGEGRTVVRYVYGCTPDGCRLLKITDDPNGTRFVQPIITGEDR